MNETTERNYNELETDPQSVQQLSAWLNRMVKVIIIAAALVIAATAYVITQ